MEGNKNDELITEHIALVGHLVRETLGRVPSHVSRDDLTSAGLQALVQAGRSFDAERGVPFNRYATMRIRGAILDELRRTDWASRSVRRRARDVSETRNTMAATLGRMPSDAEVADALGLSVEEVTANDEDLSRANVISLQGANEGGGLEEMLPSRDPDPEAAIEHRERLTYLMEAVAELPERLQVVVAEYFLAERPMVEIAEKLGVTESRVSQMRAEALVLLRDALNFALDPDLVAPSMRPGGCADRRRTQYFEAVAARHAEGAGRGKSLGSGRDTAVPWSNTGKEVVREMNSYGTREVAVR